MKETIEFLISDCKFHAIGPALNESMENPILTTDALEEGGNYRNKNIEMMLTSINGDSLTVLPMGEDTVCVITSKHHDDIRGYQLNVAFAFTGALRKLFLDYPEEFFMLYNSVCNMNAAEFRSSYKENNFITLVHRAYEDAVNSNYTISKADSQVLKTLLSSVTPTDGTDKTYIIKTDTHDKICRCMRRIPFALRKEISFSSPVYDNGFETAANVIFCPEGTESIPALKLKAGYHICLVTDEYKFDDGIEQKSSYLLTREKPTLDGLSKLDKENVIRKLTEKTSDDAVKKEKPAGVFSEKGKGKLFGKEKSVKTAKPAAEQKDHKHKPGLFTKFMFDDSEDEEDSYSDDNPIDSEMTEDESSKPIAESSEFIGYEGKMRIFTDFLNSDFTPAKIAGIILILSTVLYIIHNIKFHIGEVIYIAIVLNSFDFITIFCLVMILLSVVFLLINHFYPDLRKDS